MRRRILAALVIIGATIATPATASAASCANSFPSDGHNGPWHTPENGGTLHGNTVHIDCPSPSTHWDITYGVQIISNGSPVWVWNSHRSGNGSPPDFSESLAPSSCNAAIYGFPFRTHVTNHVTGGNINKPAGGGGVRIAC